MWSTSHVMAIKFNITKNGNVENLTRCDILYIFKTYSLCRFRIWSQNFNILSVSCVIGWFMHSKFSNYWYHPWFCQKVVLYVQNMYQKSLYHICQYCFCYRHNSDESRFTLAITSFWGIARLILSYNVVNTLYEMYIEWCRKVHFKIPCIY